MASGSERSQKSLDLSGETVRLGVIETRWNQPIVERLSLGIDRAAKLLQVATLKRTIVPGCFEIPLAAKYLAESKTVDAIVCIGAVIRGETTHYEIVSNYCARGVQQVQLETGIPIGFGVATVENEAQALARSEDAGGHNLGEEATEVAIEMANLLNGAPPGEPTEK